MLVAWWAGDLVYMHSLGASMEGPSGLVMWALRPCKSSGCARLIHEPSEQRASKKASARSITP